MSRLSFDQLITRVREGDAEAVQQLINEYGDAIRREVRFNLLDQRLRRLVAESDIFQSVVSRLVFSLRDGNFEFESAKDVTSLLKVMVRARVAQHARHWSSKKRDIRRNEAILSGVQYVQSRFAAADDARSDEDLAELALKMVPVRDRQILQWRDDGASWKEIAERLGGSAEAIRKAHGRALEEVRELLRHASGLTD